MNLYDYDILVNDIFYRGWHILEYIEKHPNMSELDRECVQNTIMDALVSKGLIDSTCQSLNWENGSIDFDLKHFCYQEEPNVVGIPLWLKEKMRTNAIENSDGLSIALHFLRPSSSFARYCLYDPCVSLAALFEDFSLDDYIYDSPTREGYRLERYEERPFLDVLINGVHYLIDVLLKRMYKRDYFLKNYAAVCTYKRSKKEFYYGEMRRNETKRLMSPTSQEQFATSLFALKTFLDNLGSQGKNAEFLYELEQSKILFPEAWVEYEEINNDFKRFTGSQKKQI